MWYWHSSDNHKWELYDGISFSSESFQRDKTGSLPDETKKELKDLLNNGQEYKLFYDYEKTFEEYRKAWENA
jgi:hypothetical protein